MKKNTVFKNKMKVTQKEMIDRDQSYVEESNIL